MNVLIATPYRRRTHPALLERAAALRAHLKGDVCVYEDCSGPVPGDLPYASNARARNHILDIALKPEHEAVLWVDVDLVDYPADIIERLDAVRDGGIAAPFVYLDGFYHHFYDTGGFIEDTEHSRVRPPHFDQPGPVYQLKSVGTLYLAPADLYRAGARYAPAPPYVEHWPVMQFALQHGYKIVADSRIEALHAHLPSFGENWHRG